MNDPLFDKAFTLYQQNELNAAYQLLKQAKLSTPESGSYYGLLGLVELQLEKNTEAVKALQNAIRCEPTNASFHGNLAQAYKRSHQYDKAIEHLQLAIELAPDKASFANNLGSLYQKQNQLKNALHYFVRATHVEPGFMPAHENLAQLLIRLGYLDKAKKQCQTILTLHPHSFIGHYQLANIYIHEDNFSAAKPHYLHALAINPHHVDCLNNLGTIALREDFGQLAVDYFTKALAIDNCCHDARSNLAATFIQYDRYENAVNHYQELLRLYPKNEDYHFNLGVAQMNLGHLNDAIYHFESVIKLNAKSSRSYINLATIYNREQKKDKARLALEKAIAIDPLDESAQYMLKALKGENIAKAPSSYIKNLFDNYAIQYEKHMCDILDYQMPSIFEHLLIKLELRKEPIYNVLDLGCGTGLIGYILKPYSKQLVGVDLSKKMLTEAKKKSLYDKTYELDIVDFCHHTTEQFSLIAASDVLNYIGDLDTLFSYIKICLTQDGYFVFTVERGKQPDYQLQNHGRFTHSNDYIENIAHKNSLLIHSSEIINARTQDKKPVKASLYVLKIKP